MRRIAQLFCVCLLVSTILGTTGLRAHSETGPRLPYRHAYYLFLAGMPNGCEDCYVPLLITKDPLDQLAKATSKADCVLITTYERDSIWQNEGMIAVTPGDIEAAARIVHLRGRKYRYQEIGSAEALKLLENPLGTIPISRPMLPKAASSGPSIEDLAAAFRSLN